MKVTRKNFLVSILFYLMTFAVYLYYFRLNQSLGDVGLIIQGGQNIALQINPYEGFDFANSPFSGLLFYAISQTLTPGLFAILLVILNASGYLLLARFIGSLLNKPVPFSILILPFLSPYRALIDAGQISGLILLLLMPLIFTIQSKKTRSLIAIFLAVIAFELKPQIALPLILFAFIVNKSRRQAIMMAFLVVLIHFITYLYWQGLDYLWIESLQRRSEKSLSNGFQVSAWKFFNSTVDLPLFWRILSAVSYLAFVYLGIALHNKSRTLAFAFMILAPLMLTYQHQYDFLPMLVVILSFGIFKGAITPFFVLACAFMPLPVNSISALATLLFGAGLFIRSKSNSLIFLGISLNALMISIVYQNSDKPLELQASIVSAAITLFGIPSLLRAIWKSSEKENSAPKPL